MGHVAVVSSAVSIICLSRLKQMFRMQHAVLFPLARKCRGLQSYHHLEALMIEGLTAIADKPATVENQTKTD